MILNKYYNNTYTLSETEKKLLSALEDGKIRTTEFWKDIPILENLNKNYLLKILSLMFPILDKIFPNNWDIHWKKYEYCFMPTIVIYFPEIEISNDRIEKTHIIKGLGLKLNFKSDSGMVELNPNLEGFRTHKTFLEYICGYQHSHLPVLQGVYKDEIMDEKSFCLGESDIIDVFYHLTQHDPFKESEQYSNYFEMLCYMIIATAKTESSDGGPYYYYEDLVVSEKSQKIHKDSYIYRDIVSKFFDYLELCKPNLNFDFIFQHNKYKIKNNSKFYTEIKKMLFNFNFDEPFVYIDRDNNEYIVKNIESFDDKDYLNILLEKKLFTIIHNKKIELEIEKNSNNIKKTDFPISKIFLNKLKNLLEIRLNEKIIKNRLIQIQNKITFEKIHNGENSILMQ